MKKLIVAIMVLGSTVAVTNESKAQVNVSVNINSQPNWGPSGYDYAQFYYLPDLNCYYDIARAQFIYLNGRRWSYAANLPARFGNVDLYNMYKVVINRSNPFRYNRTHRAQYQQFRNNHSQPLLRDQRGRNDRPGGPNNPTHGRPQDNSRNKNNGGQQQGNRR
ncbi:MAG: hypothetical protein QM642_00395 [Edaphocola sp.]